MMFDAKHVIENNKKTRSIKGQPTKSDLGLDYN